MVLLTTELGHNRILTTDSQCLASYTDSHLQQNFIIIIFLNDMSSPHIDVQKKKINEVVGFPYGTMLILISLVDEVSVWDFHTNTHTHTLEQTKPIKMFLETAIGTITLVSNHDMI